MTLKIFFPNIGHFVWVSLRQQKGVLPCSPEAIPNLISWKMATWTKVHWTIGIPQGVVLYQHILLIN